MPLLDKKSTHPETGMFEERDYDAETQEFREEYERLEAVNVNPSDTLPSPSFQESYVKGSVDVTNLLLGDEMASVGITLDREGFDWDLETAKNFWVEHPVRATLATVTTFLPAAMIATKSVRASKAAGVTDDMLTKFNLVDDPVDLTRMTSDSKDVLRQQVYTMTQGRDLAERVELGTATQKDKIVHSLNKWFGNSYMEQSDPKLFATARKEWQEGINNLLHDKGTITDFMRTMPEDTTALGVRIARYLDDPTKLSDIPKKSQAWAKRLGSELQETQSTMVTEGLIHSDEAKNVGDVWFSTVRQGEGARDIGNVTTMIDRTAGGKPRVLTVPKTASANLLQRTASKTEVREQLLKQHAAELVGGGKTDEAIALLKGEEYADARHLLEGGEKASALKLLTKDGTIDFSPKSLTINSLYNQKHILETYRTIRDIAMNPNFTKNSDEILAMGKGKRDWMNLDQLSGSDRLRRMVGVSKGDDEAVAALGWVPKKLFGEMRELVGEGDGMWKKGNSSWMEALTAMYKTAKTAFNAPTHLQNTIGNDFFLLNAGINPMSADFIKLKGISLGAINSMQKAARKGTAKHRGLKKFMRDDELPTKIKSKIGKEDIDILDEIDSPELKDLLEMTSLLQAEGIGVLQNVMKNTKGGVTKSLVNGYNSVLRGTRLERASDLYMAEDGMAKMAYFLHLRQGGFSRASALNEVGRRLPMYNSVGSVPGAMRNMYLPWITFPVEAARIMKNNLMDHPLKTAMMLQTPEFLQVGAYAAGRQGLLGATEMNAETLEGRKQQLPVWAQKPSTVMTPWKDKNGDFRGAVLDWLPYTAFMPPTTSTEAPISKKLPFGADNPMPIITSVLFAMTGKDAWGREYPVDGPMDKITNTVVNTMGLIMPPLAQRYFFNPKDPHTGYQALVDAGKAVNPYTDKAGDPVLDLFMNRVVGLKSYAASPEQQIANEQFVKRDLTGLRSRWSREWSALLKSNDLEGASERLNKIHQTFVQEHGDPGIAQEKFSSWLANHYKDLQKHPQLRGMSKEELVRKAKEVAGASGPRNAARRDLLGAYKRELGMRGRQSKGGRQNPLIFNQGMGGGAASSITKFGG